MLRSSIPLGRIRGVPVGLHWSLLGVAGLLAWILASSRFPALAPGLAPAHYWSVAAVAVAVFFGSVLVHELAHALVARRHGVGTTRITLWLLGGVAELDREAPSPKAELRIAAAGPLASIGVAAVLGVLAAGLGATGLVGMLPIALAWLAVVNVVLAVFNLIPAAPLDGGRILAAVLWRRHGDRLRAHEQATRAGSVVGWGIVGLGGAEVVLGATSGLWTMLIGWFVLSSARSERASIAARRALAGRRVSDLARPDVPRAWPFESALAVGTRIDWRLGHEHVLVVDGYDRPLGAVPTAVLWALPPAARETTTMEQLAQPPSSLTAAHGDEEVVAVLTRAGTEGALGIVQIDEQGRALGTVGRADLLRARQWGAGAPVPTGAR